MFSPTIKCKMFESLPLSSLGRPIACGFPRHPWVAHSSPASLLGDDEKWVHGEMAIITLPRFATMHRHSSSFIIPHSTCIIHQHSSSSSCTNHAIPVLDYTSIGISVTILRLHDDTHRYTGPKSCLDPKHVKSRMPWFHWKNIVDPQIPHLLCTSNGSIRLDEVGSPA